MVIKYQIYTPMLGDARMMAIQRARAEGWTHVAVMSMRKIAYHAYEVSLVVGK